MFILVLRVHVSLFFRGDFRGEVEIARARRWQEIYSIAWNSGGSRGRSGFRLVRAASSRNIESASGPWPPPTFTSRRSLSPVTRVYTSNTGGEIGRRRRAELPQRKRSPCRHCTPRPRNFCANFLSPIEFTCSIPLRRVQPPQVF